MNTHARCRVVMLALTALSAPLVQAADDPVSDVSVLADLTAVIALQGLPCGTVTTARQQAESDYLAGCSDGNRYRIFVNVDGRVVVEKM